MTPLLTHSLMTFGAVPGLDIVDLIIGLGIFAVIFVIFAESGLLIGFFLPGDSLLFTAGILFHAGILPGNVPIPFFVFVLLLFIAAVLGDSVGYWFGRKTGHRMFKKPDARIFKQSHIVRAQEFYEKHGGKTIILARFVPIVRTFAPFVAGASKMDYKKFLSFNIFGGLLWGAGITYLGYFLGNSIPNIDSYLMPVTILIIILSFTPGIIHYLSKKENRTRITDIVKNFYLKLKP